MNQIPKAANNQRDVRRGFCRVSPRIAGRIVGIAFIASVFIVTLVDDVLLANFVIPGDAKALARDIEANSNLFGFAVFGYLIVLALDSVIGLALFVVLKPASKNLALLTAGLRLLYAGALAIGVVALALQLIDAGGYQAVKRWGYVSFAFHIVILGYAILKTDYVPNILGIFLIIASGSYVFFYVDLQLPDAVLILIMLTMAIAELALSVWLIFWGKSLPDASDNGV
ncbi:MAG: DUF4386 domain-containing protein [Pseudomonadota bacterium]